MGDMEVTIFLPEGLQELVQDLVPSIHIGVVNLDDGFVFWTIGVLAISFVWALIELRQEHAQAS